MSTETTANHSPEAEPSPEQTTTAGPSCAPVSGSATPLTDALEAQWEKYWASDNIDEEPQPREWMELCRELERRKTVSQTPDGEILDWLEEHAISVRIQANERQSFVIPATREAIRFEMTSGNVEASPNDQEQQSLPGARLATEERNKTK